MESQEIPERKDNSSTISDEEIKFSRTTIYIQEKNETFNRFNVQTMQIGRLHTEERINIDDKQDLELHAID
ncbi:MAG: hypothetical protein EZS28_034846 [Streblomastix strix]|uniref:Uncharacterized protein n=1 Tax=Streblomastix strix TaxID=222440 RepID=A0A5J4UG48_9EUKA|nr:MAG: hypothetical protein EZS28_034846 [Streblomastix strix]